MNNTVSKSSNYYSLSLLFLIVEKVCVLLPSIESSLIPIVSPRSYRVLHNFATETDLGFDSLLVLLFLVEDDIVFVILHG